MKAIIAKDKSAVVVEKPTPKPRPDQILVKVRLVVAFTSMTICS
jgi:NADPH:quinone reductase-like Zn-dependent oxidoreductase